MSNEIEERVWAYLDGLMSEDEVARFERDLLRPEVAQAFAEALMVRELLGGSGPDEVPAALLRRTERAVLRDMRSDQADGRRFERARAALGGLGWAVRAPGMALSGNLGSTREALAEVGNARYTLGPFATMAGGEEDPVAPKKRSMLRRVLFPRRAKKAKK